MSVEPTVPVCPYIDQGDPRCGDRLTLLNLRETFQFCFGQPCACAAHRQIQLEESRRDVVLPVAAPA